MTAQNPPIFIQAGSHPAEDVRRWIDAITDGRKGIVGSGDFAVTENGTPNMSVNVASGRAIITGSQATYQGSYFVENRGTTNLAISAADATNPRKDLVVAKVEDSSYSGAVNAWSLVVVTGTPAGSPAEPSVPNNALVLALVDVPALDTAITNSQITDRRTTTSGQGRASALGGIITCTSTTRPSHVEGRTIYETDTDKVLTSDGSAWTRALAFDGIGIYTSGTRPAHQEGRVIYETDTDLLKMSNGAAWNDVAPQSSTLFARKTAPESVTSSITLQNDDHLTVSVAASTTYQVRADLLFTSPSTALGGFKFEFSVPTGATGERFWSATGATNTYLASSTADVWNNGGTGSANIVTGVMHIIGTLIVSTTAGSFQLRWAQLSSNATATTLATGSHLTLTKVA